MQPARLNVFQALVRHWELLHAYNGAQVLRVTGPAPADIAAQYARAAESLGLGRLIVSEGHYSLDRHPAEKLTPVFLDANLCLDAVLTDHLNRPFTDDEPPLRPILLQSNHDHFYMGLAYRHWVADSVSIRMVLREWYGRMFAPSLCRGQPVGFSEKGYWDLFGAGRDTWRLRRGISGGSAQTKRMKRVQRVEGPGVTDYRSAFSFDHLPAGTLERTKAWAKPRRAKVNDVFLAAISRAVAREGPLISTPRRQELAMGTIVDLRPYARQDLSSVFGMYLGFTTVFLTPNALNSLDGATVAIARQHEASRAEGAAPASMLRMTAGIAAHRVLGDGPRIREFYRKRLPLSGGISNVNLDNDWPAPFASQPGSTDPGKIQDFLRVSPTGPMMPLVFSVTTFGGRVNFGLTRRAALVDDAMASRLAAAFKAELAGM